MRRKARASIVPTFEAAAAELTKRARGQRAPHACVEAVRASLDLPFDEGLARERELFAELVAGDQSKALRHLFFAEREAAKVPASPADIKPSTIERAAVIGAGTMGSRHCDLLRRRRHSRSR